MTKPLIVRHDVRTPDGIGTLLGRDYSPDPIALEEGDIILPENVLLYVQFMGREYIKDGVYQYPSNLVEAV
jgi:hypothetical protein